MRCGSGFLPSFNREAKETFKPSPKKWEISSSYSMNAGKSIPGRGNSMCEGPEPGPPLSIMHGLFLHNPPRYVQLLSLIMDNKAQRRRGTHLIPISLNFSKRQRWVRKQVHVTTKAHPLIMKLSPFVLFLGKTDISKIIGAGGRHLQRGEETFWPRSLSHRHSQQHQGRFAGPYWPYCADRHSLVIEPDPRLKLWLSCHCQWRFSHSY